MARYWIVWNDGDKRGEGVIFDNEKDAVEASSGDVQQMGSALAHEFNKMYGEDGPLSIQPTDL